MRGMGQVLYMDNGVVVILKGNTVVGFLTSGLAIGHGLWARVHGLANVACGQSKLRRTDTRRIGAANTGINLF
jgi:hypothetical protein